MCDQEIMATQQETYYQLIDAVFERDIPRIHMLVSDKACLNLPGSIGNTPLHLSVMKFKEFEVMTMLLDNGADIFAKNHQYQTPLNLAIETRKMTAVKILIERGALVKDDFDASLLIAIERKNYAMVKVILDYGLENNLVDNSTKPLQAAISQAQFKILQLIMPHYRPSPSSNQFIPEDLVIKSRGQVKECVELLTACDFIIHPESHCNRKFICAAIENGHLVIVSQLLKRGIDVNMVDSTTELNLLTLACLNKHEPIVTELIEHGAEINFPISIHNEHLQDQSTFVIGLPIYRQLLARYQRNDEDLASVTYLLLAVFNSDPQTTRTLISHGARLGDRATLSILTRVAAYNDCREIVRIFLEYGVDVEDIDPRGSSLLHFCIYFRPHQTDRSSNVVKMLLEMGANVQDPLYINILYHAMCYGHRRISQYLLDHNADSQYVCANGDTLFHRAIRKDFDAEFVETLLKRNPSVNVVNHMGLTPLFIVCQKLSRSYAAAIIRLLVRYNANINCIDRNSMTPLHHACQKYDKDPNFVKYLINLGADVNAVNSEEQTPLHLIAGCQHEESANIIQVLLENGANMEAIDNRGQTPLLECLKSFGRHIDASVKCLLDHHVNAHFSIHNGQPPLYITHKTSVTPQFSDSSDEDEMDVDPPLVENDAPGCRTVINLLQQFPNTQVNVNTIDRLGNSILHRAIKKEPHEVISSLIMNGADINIFNRQGKCPLENVIKYLYSDQQPHNNPVQLEFMAQVLMVHIIQLDVAGLYVTSENLSCVDTYYHKLFRDRKSDCIKRCQQELNAMKNEIIKTGDFGGTGDISFYDLLRYDIGYLSRISDSKIIQETLDMEIYDKKFPMYIGIVRLRFRQAKIRCRLMNPARKCFRQHIDQTLSNECVDKILNYVGNEGLVSFLVAFNASNARQSSLLTRIEKDRKEILVFQY